MEGVNQPIDLKSFPDDSDLIKDVGISYNQFISDLPGMDLPQYVDRYSTRGSSGKAVTLSSYGINHFSQLLAISVEELEKIDETDDYVRIQAKATNKRYGISHYGIREQYKKFPERKDDKTGQMVAKSVPNYMEIAYVTAQRNAKKGLIPEKLIIYILESQEKEKKAKEDRFIAAAKRIEDASKVLTTSINHNSEELEELGITKDMIIDKGKDMFGQEFEDWGAGAYKMLSEMVLNPHGDIFVISSESNQDVQEDVIPPSVEDDPEIQEILNEIDEAQDDNEDAEADVESEGREPGEEG